MIDKIEETIVYGPDFIIRWFFAVCAFIIMLLPMIVWGLIAGIKMFTKLIYYNVFEIEHTTGNINFPRRK